MSSTPPDDDGFRLFDLARDIMGLGDMPVYVADRIAAALDAAPEAPGSTPAERTIPARRYGVLTPPASAFFVEARTILDGAPVYRGMVVYDRTRAAVSGGFATIGTVPKDTRTYLHGYPFMFAPHIAPGIIDYGSPTVLLHLGANGRLRDNPRQIQIVGSASVSEEERQMAAEAAASFVPFVLLAVSAVNRGAPMERVTPGEKRVPFFRIDSDK